jgi:hypothetical protein
MGAPEGVGNSKVIEEKLWDLDKSLNGPIEFHASDDLKVCTQQPLRLRHRMVATYPSGKRNFNTLSELPRTEEVRERFFWKERKSSCAEQCTCLTAI